MIDKTSAISPLGDAIDGTTSRTRRTTPASRPQVVTYKDFTVDPNVLRATRKARRPGERWVFDSPTDGRTVYR